MPANTARFVPIGGCSVLNVHDLPGGRPPAVAMPIRSTGRPSTTSAPAGSGVTSAIDVLEKWAAAH